VCTQSCFRPFTVSFIYAFAIPARRSTSRSHAADEVVEPCVRMRQGREGGGRIGTHLSHRVGNLPHPHRRLATTRGGPFRPRARAPEPSQFAIPHPQIAHRQVRRSPIVRMARARPCRHPAPGPTRLVRWQICSRAHRRAAAAAGCSCHERDGGWGGGRKTTGARQPATAGRWLARGGAVPRDSNIHAAESPPAKDARLFSFFFFFAV
jgi:hypothetical protein